MTSTIRSNFNWVYKLHNLKTLVYTNVIPPAFVVVVIVVVALINLSLFSFLLLLWIAHKRLKTTYPEYNGLVLINYFEEYLVPTVYLLRTNTLALYNTSRITIRAS